MHRKKYEESEISSIKIIVYIFFFVLVYGIVIYPFFEIALLNSNTRRITILFIVILNILTFISWVIKYQLLNHRFTSYAVFFMHIAIIFSPTLVYYQKSDLFKLFHSTNDYYIMLFVIFIYFIARMFRSILDMFMVLRRLGVKKYSFKKRNRLYLEIYYIFKYGSYLGDFSIRWYPYDYKASFSPKYRYSNYYYQKYIEDEGDNFKSMVEDKVKSIRSKSFIMKNNLPEGVTDEEICHTWREHPADMVYYGIVTTLSTVVYIILFSII